MKTDFIDINGLEVFKDEYVDVQLNTKVDSNDSRLSDSRTASDVYTWAKAATKPSYTKNEIGLGNVDNTSDTTKKSSFTGQIAQNNTGFVTGGDVYTALASKANNTDIPEWATSSTKPSYTASEVGAIATSLKGANNGVAELGSDGKVPSSQLPTYVDDVIDGYRKASDGKFYSNKSGSTYSTLITGESGKIYNDIDTNTTWRWSGTAFVQIKGDLSLGETASTAFAGNRGKAVEDKLSGIASGAQVNVIETVKVNGTALTPSSKAVDIIVPTAASANEIRSLWATE